MALGARCLALTTRFCMFWTRRISSTGKRSIRRRARTWHMTNHHRSNATSACKAMEGVEVINGLGCKMSCSSYKILYVLDTEDFFHRKKKHKKKSENLAHDKSSSQQCNLYRIERFHNLYT
ncbi:paired amphipathic helix protein Sin3-like 2 [Brassica napus]|uniref:paired amphipathic helix protein Sin3-like 2 n=1 Tax=Brassica napus TaxID=3708 RepID=UPI00207863D5|nr:paired amphipathic helix protein Sin3-like 2 [Brassica napus]